MFACAGQPSGSAHSRQAARTVLRRSGARRQYDYAPAQEQLVKFSRLSALALPPVKIFQMVGENHTFNLHPRRDGHFEGIALRMAGNRTYNRQARLLVVAPRGKDHGGPATRLLPAALRSEIKPDQIARIRHVFTSYQSSLPSGPPQSVSEWRFASVIP